MTLNIRTNKLLRQCEKGLPLAGALSWRQVLDLDPDAALALEQQHGSSVVSNLMSISESHINSVHDAYGEPGLFRLFYMAHTHSKNEFQHFYRLIAEDLDQGPLGDRAALLCDLVAALLPAAPNLGSIAERGELECDDAILPPPNDLSQLNLNVLQPSLSRKCYNPGRHEGYVVYGLGGPRILVSYPFYGRTDESYDVYWNSIDAVTSLTMRGYHGTFLFLDMVPGLDEYVAGVPAWLYWFAIVAAHSDLVIFMKDAGSGFRGAQNDEMRYIVPWVQKKVVELLPHEMRWAEQHEPIDKEQLRFWSDGGFISKAEFREKERQHVGPLLSSYAALRAPGDRLLCMDESGDITAYPLDVALYG